MICNKILHIKWEGWIFQAARDHLQAGTRWDRLGAQCHRPPVTDMAGDLQWTGRVEGHDSIRHRITQVKDAVHHHQALAMARQMAILKRTSDLQPGA